MFRKKIPHLLENAESDEWIILPNTPLAEDFLDAEIWLLIFLNLDIKDLRMVSMVARTLYRVSTDNRLWINKVSVNLDIQESKYFVDEDYRTIALTRLGIRKKLLLRCKRCGNNIFHVLVEPTNLKRLLRFE